MEPSGSECCEIEDHRRLLASLVSVEHEKARSASEPFGLICYSHWIQVWPHLVCTVYLICTCMLYLRMTWRFTKLERTSPVMFGDCDCKQKLTIECRLHAYYMRRDTSNRFVHTFFTIDYTYVIHRPTRPKTY